MDWFRRGFTEFQAVPAGERIPVLVCGRSILDHLVPGAFDLIPDESSLVRHTESLSAKLRALWLDRWISAISEVVSGAVITPDGMPGRISFPIFPFRTANGQDWHKVHCVERDDLKPKSFAKFFGLFRKVPAHLRPRVILISEDRGECSRFFSPISDMVSVYQIFPDRLGRITIGNANGGQADYFEYLASGSFAVASHQSLEFPDVSDDLHLIQQQLIRNYHVCMAQQHSSDAFSKSASNNIQQMLDHVNQYILHADRSGTEFFIAAKIQSLLLKILINDDDSESLYQAIALSKAVENRAYEQKCLRFANQIAGVSSYALECLQQSAAAIAKICDQEDYNPIHRLEYFAVMQNLFITRLFNRKNLVDPGQAVDCLKFAEDQYRYFDELGMLANSVALSFLAVGDLNRSQEYFELASTYGADRLTHLNIRINHLIASFLAGERPPTPLVAAIFDEYQDLPFLDESEYHAAMAFGNLWRLCSDKHLKQRIKKAAAARKFIPANSDGDAIIPALKKRGFLFMTETAFAGPFGAIVDHSGFMPAFHFNWSTPVTEASSR